MRFSALAAKIAYGSAKPARAYAHASLKSLKVGRKARLFLFAAFSGLTAATPVQLRFRITHAGATAFVDAWSDTVTSTDNGGWTAFSEFFTAHKPGSYLFTATIFLGGKHQHKSAAFSVTAR